VPFKVHIRGLDNLSSADVKQYASEHYSTDDFVRIEWINDTSANLIYATDYVAQEALSALTDSALLNLQPADIPLLQLRPAKPLTTSTTTSLFIRLASTVDVKKKGAHEASRYYLLNPEHDPRERKGGPEHGRSRRNWASDDDGDYNRRTFDDYEHKRRRNDASNAFSVDMYDDDAGEGFASTTSSERRKRPRRNDEDLFANRAGRATDGRLRNRSASPGRQGDGTRGFGTDYESDPLAARRGARRRSRSPGGRGRNSGKELFPAAGGSSNSAAKELFTAKKELFPAKQAPAQAGGSMRAAMDLFPANSSNASKRQSFSNHRRKGAMDASGSDTAAEFFAASSTPPPPSAGERSLAERITGRPATASVDGRGGVRIRGAAAEDGKEDIGFAIRNAGRAPTVKELFPLKAGGNAGRELLGETIKGRGGRRRKAEDMFS
jgi:hypothetical protein